MATKERAVSPVMGVILMVAITVILAAVIGTFVLDLGQNLPNQSGPYVTLEVDNPDGSNVTVTHTGGHSLDSDRLSVKVSGSAVNVSYSSAELTAGEYMEFPAESGDRIMIVWKEASDSTVLLDREI